MVSQCIVDLQMDNIISNVKKSLNQKQIVELYEIIFYNTKGDVSSHTLNRLQSLDNPVKLDNTNKSDLFNYTPYQRSSQISQLRIHQSTTARNNVGILCNIDQFTNMCKELLCLHSLYKNYNQDCYTTKSQFIDTLDGLVRNILHKVTTYLQRPEESTGWKLQKFYDITHVEPSAISRPKDLPWADSTLW